MLYSMRSNTEMSGGKNAAACREIKDLKQKGLCIMKNTYAILKGNRQFELLENDFQVNGTPIVKVTNVGICGTDTNWWMKGEEHVGQVMGHEWSGIIVDPGVSNFKEGDRVAGYTQNIHNEFCGHCEQCLAGDFEHCSNRKVYTWKGGELNHPGSYSQYTTWFPNSFFKLPETVSNEAGALLEPLAVTLHAVKRTEIQPGDKVLVLGGGIIGCSSAEWARTFGAETVAITEIVPEKMDVIRSFNCADYVLKADAPDLYEQYMEVSKGGFDVVLDCCAAAPAVNGALSHAFKPDVRARKCMTSIAYTGEMKINYKDFVLKEVVWKGTKGHFPEEFETIIKLAAEKKINIEKFITKKIPFLELQKGFEELAAMGGTPGKAMLIM